MRPQLTVLLLAALLVSSTMGCSSAGPERRRAVPAGFTLHRGDHYSFSYPPGWQVAPRPDTSGAPQVTVAGPPTAAGVPLGEVLVSSRPDADKERFEMQLLQYRAAGLLSDRELRVDRDVRVPGAVSAHRFETTVTMATASGSLARVDIVELYALTDDGVMVDFAARAPQGKGPAAQLPEVLDSFKAGQA